MSEIVRMAFRVDKELKTEAEKVFKQMGMSSTAAMKVFLAQCVREQRLPFRPGATQAEVEENGFDALLDEADKILGDENTTTSFVSFEELEIGGEVEGVTTEMRSGLMIGEEQGRRREFLRLHI